MFLYRIHTNDDNVDDDEANALIHSSDFILSLLDPHLGKTLLHFHLIKTRQMWLKILTLSRLSQ